MTKPQFNYKIINTNHPTLFDKELQQFFQQHPSLLSIQLLQLSHPYHLLIIYSE